MSNRRRTAGGGGHDGGQERWLLTYADMITLLLALFIVLFALSSIDAKKFDNLRRTLSQTFKGHVIQEPGELTSGSKGLMAPVNASQSPDNTITNPTQDASNATASAYQDETKELEQVANQVAASTASLKGKLNVEPTQQGIVVSLAGDAFFKSGSAELRPEAKRSLRAIAHEITRFGHQVSIDGHTDGQPFKGPGGNQRLSYERAFSVWEVLVANGVAQRKLETRAYGDTQPKVRPEHPDDDMEINRRIEILFLAPAADTGSSVPRRKAGGIVIPTGPGSPVTGVRGMPRYGPHVDIVDDITAVTQNG